MKHFFVFAICCLLAYSYFHNQRAQSAELHTLRVKLAASEAERSQLRDQLADASDAVDDLRNSVDDLAGAVQEFNGEKTWREAASDVIAAAASVDESTSDVESTLAETPSSLQFISAPGHHARHGHTHRAPHRKA